MRILTAVHASVRTPVRRVSDIYAVTALIREVIAWMEKDTTDTSLLAAAGAAWHLLGVVSSNRPHSPAIASEIDNAAAYLREHFEQRTTVGELAEMSSYSKSHFAALFKKHVGRSVVNYQTQLRMAAARELLDTTDMPVDSVSHAVGYDDSFYFARLFRQTNGVAPTKYRGRDR